MLKAIAIFEAVGGIASNESYTPNSNSDWNSTPPATVQQALDRIVAWIAANSTALQNVGITTKP